MLAISLPPTPQNLLGFKFSYLKSTPLEHSTRSLNFRFSYLKSYTPQPELDLIMDNLKSFGLQFQYLKSPSLHPTH